MFFFCILHLTRNKYNCLLLYHVNGEVHCDCWAALTCAVTLVLFLAKCPDFIVAACCSHVVHDARKPWFKSELSYFCFSRGMISWLFGRLTLDICIRKLKKTNIFLCYEKHADALNCFRWHLERDFHNHLSGRHVFRSTTSAGFDDRNSDEPVLKKKNCATRLNNRSSNGNRLTRLSFSLGWENRFSKATRFTRYRFIGYRLIMNRLSWNRLPKYRLIVRNDSIDFFSFTWSFAYFSYFACAGFSRHFIPVMEYMDHQESAIGKMW